MRAIATILACAAAACARAGGEQDTSIEAAPDTTVDTAPDTAPDTTPDTGPADTGSEDAYEEDAGDRDGDTVPDEEDAFPDDPYEWLDTDDDGTGDNADTDDDDDTIPDAEEVVHGEDCRVSDPTRADTDGDTIPDPEDPYPLDPWPEFVINRNEIGTFYFFLSNRDGTFASRLEWGDDIGDNYTGFSIADFAGDGKMDFIGHSATPDVSGGYDVYYFYRTTRGDEFIQILVGPHDEVIGGTIADVDDDTLIDIVDYKMTRPSGGYITEVRADTYLNNGNIASAACASADYPSTACAFTRVPAYDLTSMLAGQWVFLQAHQAFDITGDGVKDIVFAHYASGGNAQVPVYYMTGVGDGTFVSPTLIFTHNASASQAPANSIVFADFTSDTIGDVILGLDDDGDPGQAWIYTGISYGAFSSTGINTFDVNPAQETGSDRPGATTSARCFDFDFDGNMDIMVGYALTMSAPYTSQFDVRLGIGDGQFLPPVTVGPTLENNLAQSFAIPTRLCPWYGP